MADTRPSFALVERVRQKAEGAFIAFAAGDALGWPQEIRAKLIDREATSVPSVAFRCWKRKGGGRYFPHEEFIDRGEYSDDTQLMIAVARARLVGNESWWNVFTQTELPLWSFYERGGGGATKRAVAKWAKGTPPWHGKEQEVKKYFDAGGNGVAMRVLSHALFHARLNDAQPLIRDVVTDGIATHGHPRAIIGATVYAFAAWHLIRLDRTLKFGELVDLLLEKAAIWGSFPAITKPRNGWLDAAGRHSLHRYEEIWKDTNVEMRELLLKVRAGLSAGAIADDDEILRDMGCFGKANGSGTISAAASLYLCARYASQPVQGVLKAAFSIGADTDTIAAMTGGLMGCLSGFDWLPMEWLDVQDADYLRLLARRLEQEEAFEKKFSMNPRPIGLKDLDTLATALDESKSKEVDLDGVRKAKVLTSHNPKALSKTTEAKTWQLVVDDGQTIYVTKLARKSDHAHSNGAQKRKTKHAPTRTSEPNVAAINVKLVVRSLDESSKFYEEVLGMTPTKRSKHSVEFESLSLVSMSSIDKTNRHSNVRLQPGGCVIEVRVNNINVIYDQAKRSGLHVSSIEPLLWSEKTFRCHDLDGNMVEICELV